MSAITCLELGHGLTGLTLSTGDLTFPLIVTLFSGTLPAFSSALHLLNTLGLLCTVFINSTLCLSTCLCLSVARSNGGLDPWSAGGVTQNISASLVAIVIPDGAHHLDLRYNNEYDPQTVLSARTLEVDYFKQWILQAKKAP